MALVVSGSYGRLEATSGSDFDYFFLAQNDVDELTVRKSRETVDQVLFSLKIKAPSPDGAFGSYCRRKDLITDIGGKKDSNDNITRRVLFLTESRVVVGRDIFNDALIALIGRYVNDEISEHQLALFFLNDVIRYWRTLCVDFENKVFENGKDWGIRNIKLVFSRKLLYFGGILIAAETAQCTPRQKRETMRRLMALSPVERIRDLFSSDGDRALALYDSFLSRLNDPEFRQMLAGTPVDRGKHCEDFRCIKSDGQHFTFELFSLMRRRYTEYHPIYRSMLF